MGRALERYCTIAADPPWPFQWSGGKGGRRRRETELGYKTKTVDEIAALDVASLADPAGCNLFLFPRPGHEMLMVCRTKKGRGTVPALWNRGEDGRFVFEIRATHSVQRWLERSLDGTGVASWLDMQMIVREALNPGGSEESG